MADPVVVIDGSDGIYVRPSTYEVTVWPPGSECIDSATWCLSVIYSGHGKWRITRGAFSGNGPVLGRDGGWHLEHIPSERTEKELREHRFTLEEAFTLAREQAPKVMVNGMTAAEVAARHLARHGPGGCNG